MNRVDFPSLVVGVALIVFAAMTSTACGAVTCDGPVDGAGGTGGGASLTTGGGGGDIGSGGAGAAAGSGGVSTVVPPKPPHESNSAEGGAAGEWEVPSWLAPGPGARCEPTSTPPTELPSTPESSCNYLEIGLPGVMEYSLDPSGLDLDQYRADGWYFYEGCDEPGSPCIGRIEYAWDVEYLADNLWHVSLSPVHAACDYDHVAVYEGPTGGLVPLVTVAWAACELTVHLQPTALGLTIGAVRSATDEPVEAGTCTTFASGVYVDELRSLMGESLLEHLESLEWECLH